jgi:hypothetical protein
MRSIIPLALCALIGLTAAPATGAPKRGLVVVVAKGSKVRSLTRAELKRCFTGEPVVIEGQRLHPFNFPPSSAERIAFDRAVLGMSPDEAGRFWVDRKIRGQSEPPRSLPSIAHVTKIVTKFAGAIGYLPADQVSADVMVIDIEGVRELR